METNKMFEIKEPLELMPFEDTESQYWYVKYLANSLEQYKSKARAYEALLNAHCSDKAVIRKKLKEEEAKNAKVHKKIEELQAELECFKKQK